ncbi:MAG: SRPBCC family protein [Polyangiales bacterium]
MVPNDINWPERFRPEASAVHVVNSLQMDASSQSVWNCLVRATDWPDWYPNASNVNILGAASDTLELGTRFRWKTFGVTIECTVEEFQPAERLAWSSESFGMSVYHAWLISPRPQGCYVVTEETQNGFIPRIGKVLAPGRMHKFHQIWLDRLNEIAGAAA